MSPLRPFNHADCTSLAKAAELLRGRRTAAVAGGTDLLGTLKDRIHPDYPELLVNLKTIPGLEGIRREKGHIVIGAMTRLADLAANPLVGEMFPALAEAARSVATPQIRNMATLGGNLCQEPRCWYYRHPDNRYHCLRKGGDTCPARIGENRYHSVFGPVRRDAPPCSAHCPAGTDIADHLEAWRAGDLDGAARIILKKNPLPAVTGRVCPHYCQEGCGRREVDGSVNIREAERYLGDYILDRAGRFYTSPEQENGRSAAVIGSGPSGLAAAYFLRKAGFSVTVYEALEEPGGMLRHSLPAYRLPEETVDRTVVALEGMGIVFRCGEGVDRGRLEDLGRTCDAVYVSTGAWESAPLSVEGTDLAVPALELLKQVRQGLRNPGGRHVVVIGGGNVAVDTAVTARRLGAEQVSLVCLETRDGMPADEEEIEAAEAEGVEVVPSRGVSYISRTPDGACRLELVRCTSVFDDEGRFAPRYDREDTDSLEADAVFTAVGQRADTAFLPPEVLGRDGRTAVDTATGRTGLRGLYAGGDLLGPANVIDAVAAAARAAESILADLGIAAEGNTAGEPIRFLDYDPGVLSRGTALERNLPLPDDRTVDREDFGTLRRADLEREVKRCLNCGCVAVNPSDTATVLTALDAVVMTNERAISVAEFFDCLEGSSTVLRPGEIVTAVHIPEPKPGSRTVYLKYRDRQAIDFPVIGVAVRLDVEDGTITDARVCLGAAAAFPLRILEAEKYLVGKKPVEAAAPLQAPPSGADGRMDALPYSKAAALVTEGMIALPENAWKIRLFRAYARRAIRACLEPATG